MESAAARDDRKDGISYLIQMRRLRIDTPLCASYAEEILCQTGATTLDAAWSSARQGLRRHSALKRPRCPKGWCQYVPSGVK